ncbi:hypothetical protein GQ42DRAFT_103037, partial [Ramicandelaber brevisporus]
QSLAVGTRSKQILIDIRSDAEFFSLLRQAFTQLATFQQSSEAIFKQQIAQLCESIGKASSPYLKDITVWREIFREYLDANIWDETTDIGGTGEQRVETSIDSAAERLDEFLEKMKETKLSNRFKVSGSRPAYAQFIELNISLMRLKRFNELNRMALYKILKKHDKRTHLPAAQVFPKLISGESTSSGAVMTLTTTSATAVPNIIYTSSDLFRALKYSMYTQLLTLVPQIEDHSCPICLNVCWKPIKLACGHRFCARCLVNASKMGIKHCPMCRRQDAVAKAQASDLDVTMMRFMKLYFPKEVKQRQADIDRE